MTVTRAAVLPSEASLAEQVKDLERIAQLENPVLRNLLITQRYHDLSHDLTTVLGTGNANWSTFATWASRTAGRSIRKEDVPKEFVHFLKVELRLEARLARFEKRLGPIAALLPDLDPFALARAILDEVSSQIAIGNLRVYHELTPLFARFACQFADPAHRSQEAIERFIAQLAEGAAKDGGQDDLKKAFRAYYEAAACEEGALRAQLILYGNVLIGLHEQTRLQENIAGALDAPFSQSVYESLGAFGPRFMHPIFRGLIRRGVKLLASELLDDWQRTATRLMMKLQAPNGEDIPLGGDLPPSNFDPLLRVLTLSELVAFLSIYDPDLTTTKGSGAVNWTLLQDRMRFIGELFRVAQTDISWFEQPFEPAQREEFEAGRVPPGLGA